MADQPINPEEQGDLAPTDHPLTPEEAAGGMTETPQELHLRQERDQRLHQNEELGAATAATGLGCLAFATLPWSIFAVIFIALLIAGFFRGCWWH